MNENLSHRSNISIVEMSGTSDFWNYFTIVIQGRQWSWIIWVLIMKLFGRKETDWFIVKDSGKIIGGFAITDLPVAKYKPFNIFDTKARQKIDELSASGYRGFCCFIISSKYRNSGIGSYVFDAFFKKSNPMLKVYFTATKKAVPLYLRQGAKIAYPAKYTIYTYETD